MHFEWDEEKNLVNIGKHGIDFETAILCWEDPSNFDIGMISTRRLSKKDKIR